MTSHCSTMQLTGSLANCTGCYNTADLIDVKCGETSTRFPAPGKCVCDRIPYPDASFDKVCSINNIYFWPSVATTCVKSGV